jgi:hypothetical protein
MFMSDVHNKHIEKRHCRDNWQNYIKAINQIRANPEIELIIELAKSA